MSDVPGLWNRAGLVNLLAELASRLDRRGVTASIYVVGGAAISLSFDARRATRDIDAVVLDNHGALTEEVGAMARQHGLATTWLNEQASAYVSTTADPRSSVVFDAPGLKVAAASAEPLLAMKVAAARPTDVADIRLLANLLGIQRATEAIAIFEQAFPGQRLGDRQRLVVEDTLNDPSA